jgi:cell wall-associated NlpC family hydrolase
VFFATGRKGTVNHVGIYLTDGSFIHSSTSNGVMLSSLKEPYWNQRWKGARRVR